MARRRGNAQAARAVEGQVVPGEDHRVHIAVVDLGKAAAVGKGVLRALGQGEEHLVGLGHVDGGEVLGGDRNAVQHQLDFVVLGRADDDAALVIAGEDIGARGGDGDGAVANLHRGVAGLGVGAIQSDGHGLVAVIVAGEVALGEQLAFLRLRGGLGEDVDVGLFGIGVDIGIGFRKLRGGRVRGSTDGAGGEQGQRRKDQGQKLYEFRFHGKHSFRFVFLATVYRKKRKTSPKSCGRKYAEYTKTDAEFPRPQVQDPIGKQASKTAPPSFLASRVPW